MKEEVRMKILRSVASVIVAYIVVFAIVLGSDPVLARIYPGQYVRGHIPPNFILWIGTAIYAVASILGGWICVRLAPSKPGKHLLVLFLFGEAMGLVSTILNWNHWPHWQSLVWLVLWPICLWIGGLGQSKARAAAPIAV
jgi:nitrate/nitrite transporter NarK